MQNLSNCAIFTLALLMHSGTVYENLPDWTEKSAAPGVSVEDTSGDISRIGAQIPPPTLSFSSNEM
jgi:hypothetical protein